MADLLLGPILRFVDTTDATVWIETDAPCEVEILGHRTPTFRVGRHHYALVRIGGLDAGSENPYDVRLDGERVWPRPYPDAPPPIIRTRSGAHARIALGSCRAAAPDELPWTAPPGQDDRALGSDALLAYARRMRDQDPADWPQLVLMLGDQVYADSASPETREFIRGRRDTSVPPGEEVADFEEYTRLYREAWGQPELLRWVLATVPSAMIFDDHDIIDDWNISRSWIEDMRGTDWWDERIVSGLVAYWVYQHLGNLDPADLEGDELWKAVNAADDAEPLLREVAREADRDPASFRWSYDRQLGGTHLVVVDSRAGRIFRADGSRGMLDESEWDWLGKQMEVPCEHLVVASSLPVFLPRLIHHGEQWNEAVARGAWGRTAIGPAERIRRAIDLEHWSAFPESFQRLARMLQDSASRDGGPRSVTVVSGDIHHGYLARIRWPESSGVPVWQIVASPMRQSLESAARRGFGVADRRGWVSAGRMLARLARVPEADVDWRLEEGPVFDNHIATLELGDRGADARLEAATGHPATLETVVEKHLAD